MLDHGTLTAEAKSGYGLDRDTELKSLRAIRSADEVHPVDAHPTFLGAHTVPPEFSGAAEYVDFVIRAVLPDAAPLARAADVFLERGSFEVPEARMYRGLRGLWPGAQAARRPVLRAWGDTARHRARRPQRGPPGEHWRSRRAPPCQKRRRGGVAAGVRAVPEPPTPPARLLVEEGAIVALATDFNPGSSFCESLPLVMNLACTRLKLSPRALCACTANAAHVLGLDDVGRLAPGYKADILVLDAPDWRYVAYHLGGDRFAARIKAGQVLA